MWEGVIWVCASNGGCVMWEGVMCRCVMWESVIWECVMCGVCDVGGCDTGVCE